MGVGASLSDYNTRLPQPAQLGGGPLQALVHGPQARQKKKEDPLRVPPTRKGGSREEEPLPPWCSFLRLSSKESRAPARGRAGNGALRPEASEKPHPPEGYVGPLRQARAPTKQGPFFCAILCNFFAPTVYAGVQLWPRFPRG